MKPPRIYPVEHLPPPVKKHTKPLDPSAIEEFMRHGFENGKVEVGKVFTFYGTRYTCVSKNPLKYEKCLIIV